MARVWGKGLGTQCKSRHGPSDYCTRHNNQALVTKKPCQYTENGKHIGLFWGRVDEPKPYKCDGLIAVQWKDPASVKLVTEALASGTKVHPFSREGKRPKKTKMTSLKTTNNNELGNDEVGDILSQGLFEIEKNITSELIPKIISITNMLASLPVTQPVKVEESIEMGSDDLETLEVEEHKLADGTDVLKGADGTLYDPESLDIVGSWNEADNNNNGEVTNVTHCVPYTLPHHLDAMYSFKETASGYNVITTRAK
jgi:hypothetical protein